MARRLFGEARGPGCSAASRIDAHHPWVCRGGRGRGARGFHRFPGQRYPVQSSRLLARVSDDGSAQAQRIGGGGVSEGGEGGRPKESPPRQRTSNELALPRLEAIVRRGDLQGRTRVETG